MKRKKIELSYLLYIFSAVCASVCVNVFRIGLLSLQLKFILICFFNHRIHTIVLIQIELLNASAAKK